MGIDFFAILDVSVSWDEVESKLAVLDDATIDLPKLGLEDGARWTLEIEDVEYFDEKQSWLVPVLVSPCSYDVTILPQYARVKHQLWRWSYFLEFADCRNRLREWSQRIAKALGATRILYLSERLIDNTIEDRLQEESFATIESFVRAKCGNPSDLTRLYGRMGNERFFLEPVVEDFVGLPEDNEPEPEML